jgi:adenosine deaminase
MFNTDMNNEYLQLNSQLGLSVDELMRISLDSIETSFLPAKKKAEMREDFLKEYRELVSRKA